MVLFYTVLPVVDCNSQLLLFYDLSQKVYNLIQWCSMDPLIIITEGGARDPSPGEDMYLVGLLAVDRVDGNLQ